MTLDEAVTQFESTLTVHDQMGCPADAEYDGPMDFSRAPTGEPYITLTSGGIKKPGYRVPAWFADKDEAIAFWLMEAKHYAKEHGTQLYWREKPELTMQTFVAIDQASAILKKALHDTMSVELWFVWSRLLVSKKGPNGKEI